MLIANTTELEFKEVLEGLCKQTKSFSSECLSIVDNYYIKIYQTLLTNLDENEACCTIEICPRGLSASASIQSDFAPLLPAVQAAHLDVHITAKPRLTKKNYLGESEPVLSQVEINQFQLPIDTLLSTPNADRLVEGGNFCLICEYAMQYIDSSLSTPVVEEEIKEALQKLCTIVPSGMENMCNTFVDTYSDALIALLVEEFDPKTVCPKLLLCAAAGKKQDVEVMFPVPAHVDAGGITVKSRSGAEKCPMCLFAVSQAQAAVKSDKSVVSGCFVVMLINDTINC